MPLVEVSLAHGRTAEQIRSLIDEVHAAVVRAVGAAPDNVTVLVREVPRSHWARGGTTIAERDAATGSATPGSTSTSPPTTTPTEAP